MKKIIVMGHGGYAEGIRQNIEMIAGVPECMHFVDLTKEDDINSFKEKLNLVMQAFGSEDEILFVCDLAGASPFRVAAEICILTPGKHYTTAGLNQMAILELSMSGDSELSIRELTDRAVETTRTSVVKFPE